MIKTIFHFISLLRMDIAGLNAKFSVDRSGATQSLKEVVIITDALHIQIARHRQTAIKQCVQVEDAHCKTRLLHSLQ